MEVSRLTAVRVPTIVSLRSVINLMETAITKKIMTGTMIWKTNMMKGKTSMIMMKRKKIIINRIPAMQKRRMKTRKNMGMVAGTGIPEGVIPIPAGMPTLAGAHAPIGIPIPVGIRVREEMATPVGVRGVRGPAGVRDPAGAIARAGVRIQGNSGIPRGILRAGRAGHPIRLAAAGHVHPTEIPVVAARIRPMVARVPAEVPVPAMAVPIPGNSGMRRGIS
jgi:hypothetical protein